LPARTKALVVGIQDSRTIEVVIERQPLSQVFVVRLLGVEPPLLSDPWAGVAYEWLAREIGREVVVLESDAVERDGQGNLLRYVWKEGTMVNVAMIQRGLASTTEDAAMLNYSVDLLDAQSNASNAERGLWGPAPTPTPTPFTPTATLTTTQVLTAVLTATLVVTGTPTATLESASSP
jgi:endonuclease YncB( thermonuclease family)